MKSFSVAQDIVPLGKFKTRASKYLRQLSSRRRPLVITQNGQAAAVVISPEEYDRLSEHARFIDAVDMGIVDSNQGRVVDDEELAGELDAMFTKSDE